MCGRVTLALDKQMIMDILADVFNISNTPAISNVPNYNIGPSSKVLSLISGDKRPSNTIHNKDGLRAGTTFSTSPRAGYLSWGFVPSWAKEEDINYSLINARSETVSEKSMFKSSFQHKRCIILADSFYEWKREKIRRPFRFQVASQTLFPMAGLYSSFIKKNGDKLFTCSILTCPPNELMKPIHHRMPVILTPESSKIWLAKESSEVMLKDLLKPYPASDMNRYEVSSLVNSIKNNSPNCIKPVGEQQAFL